MSFVILACLVAMGFTGYIILDSIFDRIVDIQIKVDEMHAKMFPKKEDDDLTEQL